MNLKDKGTMPDGRWIKIPEFPIYPADIVVTHKNELYILEASCGENYLFRYAYADKDVAEFVAMRMREEQMAAMFWAGLP